MSLKRIIIRFGLRSWLTKRWRMIYCCLALTCFAFVLISTKQQNEITFNRQLTDSRSLSAISSQQNHIVFDEKISSINLARDQSTSGNPFNNIIRNSWFKLTSFYDGYSNYVTKNDAETESNLLTLYSSSKYQKLNKIDFDVNQPVYQMNISEEMQTQLDFVVKRVINYYESINNLSEKNRIKQTGQTTIDLIQQMFEKQVESQGQLTKSYTDQWQPVIGPKEKSRLYSAYYETRLENSKFIRVIGAARTNFEVTDRSEPLYCALWYIEKTKNKNNQLKLQMTSAINRAIRENWNLLYSAYYLLCPLPSESQVPIGVSILKNKSPANKANEESNDVFLREEKRNDEFVFHPLGNFVLVQNNHLQTDKRNDKQTDRIAICVKPLHYNYNKLDNMIEFIELNRILGIDHFLFYNHTIGSKVDCLLNHYSRNTDLVTILPWHNLDLKSQKEIRTEGIFASLNDCLYRTMYRFKYVAMIDLDEFIIPHLDDDLKLLINRLTNLNVSKNRVGAFSFQNGFYYLQWPDDSTYLKLTTGKRLPIYLTTLAKTSRRAILHNHRERSKLIVKPESVLEVGNHFVWQFLPTKSAFHISEKAAYLHHYRICEFGGTACLNTPSIIDHRIQHWSKQLIQKSISTFETYNQTCVSPNL